MRILGIDPGLDATGYGIIDVTNGNGSRAASQDPLGSRLTISDSLRLVEAGLIRTPAQSALSDRLAVVAHALQNLLAQHHPDCMAVEDLYSYYKTPQPAILMGHVRGVVLSTAALAKIPVVSYLPTRIKKAVVGRGHAPKGQIAQMVQMRLRFEGNDVPPDVSDALAVALCHMETLRVEELGVTRRRS